MNNIMDDLDSFLESEEFIQILIEEVMNIYPELFDDSPERVKYKKNKNILNFIKLFIYYIIR